MGLTLKQHRLVREKSLAEMAAALGVHVNTYMRWEAMPETVKVVDAIKIAKVLNVSVDEIVFAIEGET